VCTFISVSFDLAYFNASCDYYHRTCHLLISPDSPVFGPLLSLCLSRFCVHQREDQRQKSTVSRLLADRIILPTDEISFLLLTTTNNAEQESIALCTASFTNFLPEVIPFYLLSDPWDSLRQQNHRTWGHWVSSAALLYKSVLDQHTYIVTHTSEVIREEMNKSLHTWIESTHPSHLSVDFKHNWNEYSRNKEQYTHDQLSPWILMNFLYLRN